VSELAARIRLQLERSGRSAREVSRAIGASKNFVQSLLDGESKNPSVKHMKALARELGVTLEYLDTGRSGPDDEARDGLQIALSEPWWEPSPLPSPEVAAAISSEARAIRNRLGSGGSLDVVYWRAWLRDRHAQLRRGLEAPAGTVVQDEGGTAADDLGRSTKSTPRRR
jgi:transcriptional regulator with XRE-family HTH domain